MAMHCIRYNAASIMLAALIMAPVSTQAAPDKNVETLLVSQRALTLQEAVSHAQRQFKGKVIKAYPVHVQGKHAYRIRIMRKDGRVREVVLDARSGKPLRRQKKQF